MKRRKKIDYEAEKYQQGNCNDSRLGCGQKIGKKPNHSSAKDGNLAEKPGGEYFSKQKRNQFR